MRRRSITPRIVAAVAALVLTGDGARAEAEPPIPADRPSSVAASFVQLLEQHDYWRRASNVDRDAARPTELSRLQADDSGLKVVCAYDRIHLDYGHRALERDPMHWFSLLEIDFCRAEDIPEYNGRPTQVYPNSRCSDCKAPPPDGLVFPLWEYRAMVHYAEIDWRHLEYIDWCAVRSGSRLFVVYTIPTNMMSELPPMTRLLGRFLNADTPAAKDSVVAVIRAHRERAQVDYDTVKDLQELLKRAGFFTDIVDGVWGYPTEDGLKKLLQSRGLWTVAPEKSGLGAQVAVLREFQRQRHLPVTGRCDPATLAALSGALDRH
jgi:hypothetical protein